MEQSINYELGGRLRIHRWLTPEGTGFLTLFRNQVGFDTAPGGTDIGRTERHGMETAATLEIGAS